jgi:hypothetical protein
MRYPTLHSSPQLWTFGPHEASVGCGPTPILRNRLKSLPRDCLILHYARVAKGRKPGDFYGQWKFFGWSGVKQIIRSTPQAQKYGLLQEGAWKEPDPVFNYCVPRKNDESWELRGKRSLHEHMREA